MRSNLRSIVFAALTFLSVNGYAQTRNALDSIQHQDSVVFFVQGYSYWLTNIDVDQSRGDKPEIYGNITRATASNSAGINRDFYLLSAEAYNVIDTNRIHIVRENIISYRHINSDELLETAKDSDKTREQRAGFEGELGKNFRRAAILGTLSAAAIGTVIFIRNSINKTWNNFLQSLDAD